MERVLVVTAFVVALLLPAPLVVDATYGCAHLVALQAAQQVPATDVVGCAGR